MEAFTIEFWVVLQMLIDLALVILIVYLLRSLRIGLQKDVAQKASEQVLHMIEPLLKEAQVTSENFDRQLKEKNGLIHSISDKLDSRIISLNLLLNRAGETLSADGIDGNGNAEHVYDQQEAIVNLYEKGEPADAIARQLSMPKGEVELVIGLKRKFEEIG